MELRNSGKESILVTHQGWFLFCPIWFSEHQETAIPRLFGWWAFDLALEIQQFRNCVLSFFGIEGGFPFKIKPLKSPKVISFFS